MSITKTGITTANTFSETGLIEDMELKTLSDGSVWAKVFEHNSKSGTVLFTTIAEVKNTQTADKYSRLYLLSSLKASDGKLELMLEYPDYSTTKYNRWKQTNPPQDEFVTETSEGTGTATGYEAIHCDWTERYWGGLTRQLSNPDTIPSNNTYISGSVGHSNWWFAIAPFKTYNSGMPGPDGVTTTGRVQLWVRIDTVSSSKVSISKNCILSRNFIEV